MASTGTAIVASVLIAVILTMGLVYVANPYLFPQKGVVQTKSISQTGPAYIFSSQNTAYSVINNSKLAITTRGGSFLDVQFTAQGLITLDPTFAGIADWYVAVLVENSSGHVFGNDTILPAYYNVVAVGNIVQIPVAIAIQLITGTLPAGTYNVTAQWKSATYSALFTYLDLADATLHNPRVLVAQEIVP